MTINSTSLSMFTEIGFVNLSRFRMKVTLGAQQVTGVQSNVLFNWTRCSRPAGEKVGSDQ